jgi:hypothetical protein
MKKRLLSSTKSKEVWRIIHIVPKPKLLRFDLDELNAHFVTTANRKLDTNATSMDELLNFIEGLLASEYSHTFNLSPAKTFTLLLPSLKQFYKTWSTVSKID